MNIGNVLFNVSGTGINWTGSHSVGLVLLCGMSGSQVIPIQVTNEGRLISVSGA